MDLRNQTITVGELLDNPAARGVFQRRFGPLMKHPLVAAGRCLTLAQLAEMARAFLPEPVIRATLQELERL